MVNSFIHALSTIALVLGLGFPEVNAQELKVPRSKPAAQRRLATVLLNDVEGNHRGSGVFVGIAEGGYWLATNRHVVQGLSKVCVIDAYRNVNSAIVIPPKGTKESQELDLALLWMPNTGKRQSMVARMESLNADRGRVSLIVATGYPAPSGTSQSGSSYNEMEGLIIPLLEQPLEGGFDLAYTAAVYKGMSGGGVFINGYLIGINGAHANPLWPGTWHYQSGKPVDEILNKKLEQVSLGISARSIFDKLRGTLVPSAKSTREAATQSCLTRSSHSQLETPR